MPLPTTSAIDSATRLREKRMASKQSPPTPEAGCHDADELEAVHLRQHRGQEGALDAPCFLELARLSQRARAPFAAGRDLGVQQRDERRVVPGLLNEVPHAAAHGLDREVDRAPARHHDDRQRAVERLQARQEIDPFAARRGVAGVVQIHQHQIEPGLLHGGEGGFGRMHCVDVHPFRLQQQAERVDEIRLIVGDQYPGGHGAGGRHDLVDEPNSCAIRDLRSVLRKSGACRGSDVRDRTVQSPKRAAYGCCPRMSY